MSQGTDLVTIYGGDHSPWVQAVLLGLHLKGIDYRVVTFPTCKVFAQAAVLMPAMRLDDGRWMLQSQDILEANGYDRMDPQDMRDFMRTLRGGVHRTDSTCDFWRRWSWVRDEDPSRLRRLRNFLFRPFLVLYFQMALRALRRNNPKAVPSWEESCEAYERWQQRLKASGGPFLDGASPGIRDIYLFAGVQLHASVPVPPLEVLAHAPELEELRCWVEAMEQHCDGYRHMYSRATFATGAAPPRAAVLERVWFWLGSLTVLVLLPLAVPFAKRKINEVRERKLLTRSARI